MLVPRRDFQKGFVYSWFMNRDVGGNNYYCIYHRFIAKVGFRVESSELDPENAIKISEDITKFIEVLIFQTALRKFQKSCCIPVIQTIQLWYTLLGINISPSKAFLKMSFFFPQVGYVNSLEGNML